MMNFFGSKGGKKPQISSPSNLPNLADKPSGKVFLNFSGDDSEFIYACQLANALGSKEVVCSSQPDAKIRTIIEKKLKKKVIVRKDGEGFTPVELLRGSAGKDVNKEQLFFAVDQTKDTLKSNIKMGVQIIGFSCSKSCCDGTRKVARLWHHTASQPEENAEIDPRKMLNMIKSGEVNFEFMKNIFSSMETMMDNPMLASMGFKLDQEMKAKIKNQAKIGESIYYSMTKRERKELKLLTTDPSANSRIERIAKGSGVPKPQIMQHIEMVKTFREKGGDIASLMSDPNKLKDMMSNLRK
jgi:hypothetical protein